MFFLKIFFILPTFIFVARDCSATSQNGSFPVVKFSQSQADSSRGSSESKHIYPSDMVVAVLPPKKLSQEELDRLNRAPDNNTSAQKKNTKRKLNFNP